MTGQVKEQVLTRFGELGVEVLDGCVHFVPRLIPRAELVKSPTQATFTDLDGGTTTLDLMPGSLAFTYCGVPIIYREGEVASVELERADGRLEAVPGAGLSREQSASLFGRVGIYRRLTVTVPTGSFYE